MEMARDERREFADFLATLTPEQWDGPSLCSQWRVRDVVAHTISCDDELTTFGLAVRFLRRRTDCPIASTPLGSRLRQTPARRTCSTGPRPYPTPRIDRRLRRHDRTLLLDGMVHQQDIRRPLGMPRVIPSRTSPRRSWTALYVPLIRGLGGPARSDSSPRIWTGPRERSRGSRSREALLMAMAGRPHALQQLDGGQKCSGGTDLN